jgi:quercetin dioxygenase-like cupin family protein
MRIQRRLGKLTAIAWLLTSIAAVGIVSAQPPGACNTPVSERTSEIGCYLTATQSLGLLPQSRYFWHLYIYPNRAVAEAAKGLRGAIVESFGKIWLYTIAESEWRPSTGERIAVIGPLEVDAGRPYTARYMEAVFSPGMHSTIHRHSGPEAWYLLAGTQCLETPEGIIVARAGEGAVVRQGPSMRLSSVGNETRRSVLLVLHDASQPWVNYVEDWKPKGLCPK